MLEFDGRILSSKAPVDGDLLLVAPRGPGGDLPRSDLQGGYPLRQALPIQRRELDLSHVEPTGMLGGVMDLKALREPTRLSDRKDLVEGSERMRIEVIHDQDDLFGIRIVQIRQLADEQSPLLRGPLSGHHGIALAPQRFAGQKHIAHSLALVLVVLAGRFAWLYRQGITDIRQQLRIDLIHADLRSCGSVRARVDLQDILHVIHKLSICLGGNAPLFFDPGLELVGQQHLAHGFVADRLHIAQLLSVLIQGSSHAMRNELTGSY
jgi:hypothetical protein